MTEISTDIAVGGADISFDVTSLNTDETIIANFNIGIWSNYDTVNVLVAQKAGYVLVGISYDVLYENIETFKYVIDNVEKVRILFHNEFITVYLNDAWVYTFAVNEIDYPDTLEIYLSSVGSPEVDNIKVKELHDWRDAIFIDLETSTMNAIQSIIQQRPVDISTKYDGSIEFYYEPSNRQQVAIDYIRDHTIAKTDSSMLASDAIVYYSDVAVISDPDTAENIGFITRMYRMSELDCGAIQAAKTYQKKARQQTKMHSVTCRFNLAIEHKDIAVLDYYKTSTGVHIQEAFIVENIQFQLGNASATMVISGRDYYA